MKKLLPSFLLALSACAQVDHPSSVSPSVSEGGSYPAASQANLPSLSDITQTELEPSNDRRDMSPAVDFRDIQVCELAFFWQELTGQPVSCSGEALVSFAAPLLPKSVMSERVEGAIRSVSSVRKTSHGLEVVAGDESRTGRTFAGSRDDATLVSLDAPEDAVRGAMDALSIDGTLSTDREGAVQVLASRKDTVFLKELFGDAELVDASFYLPSLAESWDSLSSLYGSEGLSFDERTSVLHVRSTQETLNSLFSRLRYYTVPEQPVRVRAWIVESRDDVSRRFGLNLSGDGTDLVSGLIANSAVLVPTLQLLENTGSAKLLSSPELLVKSGQDARVNAGDSYPVPRTTVAEGVVSTEYDYRNTGISMTISPTVRPDGSVTLDVDLEASTASGSGEAPVIARRAVSSSLHLSDGQTVALSGLRTLSSSEAKSGLPGGLPLPIGRSDSVSNQSSYLTVFLSVDVL